MAPHSLRTARPTGGNLRARSELALKESTVIGPVVLSDARIEGPLRLIGTRLDVQVIMLWPGYS